MEDKTINDGERLEELVQNAVMSLMTRILIRRDSSSNWEDANTLLAEGEIGYETDSKHFKIGDDVTEWNALDYAGSMVFGTPVSATAPGKRGMVKFDASYIYVCVADNTWRRSAVASW